MKRIRQCLAVLVILAGSTHAFGAPFLVSDPYPSADERPGKFLVTINGKTVVSEPVKNKDGSVYLKYDLGGLPDGTYRASIRAVDKKGVKSPPTVCSFTKTDSKVELLTPARPEDAGEQKQGKQKRPPSRSFPVYKSYPGYLNR